MQLASAAIDQEESVVRQSVIASIDFRTCKLNLVLGGEAPNLIITICEVLIIRAGVEIT